MTVIRGTLYLVWREPETRAQHKIGELSYDGFHYKFRFDLEECRLVHCPKNSIPTLDDISWGAWDDKRSGQVGSSDG